MKFHPWFLTVCCVLSATVVSPAAVHYVDVNSAGPASPYTSWATAAANIQDAIDVASAGDLVLVSNGIYETSGRVVVGTITNRVVVNKAITVQSVNGPDATFIKGNSLPTAFWHTGSNAVRCVYMTNGAVLAGFTLTNGACGDLSYENDYTFDPYGGGVWCESTNVLLMNCVLIGNFANSGGGGAYRATLNNCVLQENAAWQGGGAKDSVLNNCLVTNNAGLEGGGVNSGICNHCILVGNHAIPGSVLKGGGGLGGNYNNCLIVSNTASRGGGLAGASTVNNCTIVGNTGTDSLEPDGGIHGAYFVHNCIIYNNYAPLDVTRANYSGSADHTFTVPLITSGVGNFDSDPLFVDSAHGNYRLQSNSPCINAGYNAWVPWSTDLDGNLRIAGGTVDAGAYEFQSPASVLSYVWLQQYDLPTDGSADYVDTDGDGHNNWQEWRALTDPTSDLSVLKMSTVSNSVSSVTVSWQSVSNVNYFLQRSADLGATPCFLTVISNIVGQAGTTGYTDTNAVGDGPFFYRVGVQ